MKDYVLMFEVARKKVSQLNGDEQKLMLVSLLVSNYLDREELFKKDIKIYNTQKI